MLRALCRIPFACPFAYNERVSQRFEIGLRNRMAHQGLKMYGRMATTARIALAIDVVIAVAEPIVWLRMATSRGVEAFTATGLVSLKYFTVLSNLLLGLASLVCAVYLIRYLRRGLIVPKWAHLLKFAGTVAVTITLMTVLLFLGPRLGYAAMFAGVNLWFHGVLPVLGIAGFVFFDTQRGLSFKESFVGLVPVVLYGVFYVGNILINGVGVRPNTNDWYGFTLFGMQLLPVVLLVMVLATWVFALILRAVNAAVRKRRTL